MLLLFSTSAQTKHVILIRFSSVLIDNDLLFAAAWEPKQEMKVEAFFIGVWKLLFWLLLEPHRAVQALGRWA